MGFASRDWYESRAKVSTFVFSSPIVQALWKEELCGQISDGYWENTRNAGFPYWCNIKTSVGDTTKLCDRTPYGIKQSFGFTRLISNEDVCERMMDIVKRFQPNATVKDLRKYLQEITNAMKEAADS